MRTLLIAAAAVSAMPTPRAEACGGYVPEPQVMMVSTHHLATDDGSARQRTFVVLGERAPDGLTWSRLAPLTFDNSKIASAPPLAEPMEVTLVGPSGTRTLKLRNRVYLTRAWGRGQPSAALEVDLAPGEDFSISLPGAARAAWLPLDHARSTDRDVAWLARQGIEVASPESVYVQPIRGTGFEAVVAHREGAPAVTVVRRGDQYVGVWAGTPAAAYSHDGSMRLVTWIDRATIRTRTFAAAAR